MSAFFIDWGNVIPLAMIAAGFLMVLVGFIASRRHRFEESQEESLPDLPRPRMAPLPRLLSTERAEHDGNNGHKKANEPDAG